MPLIQMILGEKYLHRLDFIPLIKNTRNTKQSSKHAVKWNDKEKGNNIGL